MREIEKSAEGNQRFEFVANMISIDEKVLQNSNGTNYKLCTVEFLDVNDSIQQAKSAIYETVYKNGVEINSKYAAIATIIKDKVFLNVTSKLNEFVITILSIKDSRLSIGGKKINNKSCNVEFFYQNQTHELPVKFTDYLLNYGIEEGKKYRALCKLDSPLEIFEILACVSENISIYPSISSYIESLAFAPDIFSKYATLIPFYDMEGDLIFSSGNYAAVFKMKCQISGKIYALKVFHRSQEGRTESYTHISKHINNTVSPYLVHYDYCENEIEVDGLEYPALIMEWVEGQTLGNYLTELVQNEDKDGIFQLACNFDKMALWLLEQPFAHGDLKTDNILIDENGTLRLIDYDGMFTPEMQGQHARENGSPGFRHPGRLLEHFGQHIDDFSILLISFCIHALAIDPNILDNSVFNDNLLFTEEELSNFSSNSFLNLNILQSNPVTATRLVMLHLALGNPATTRLLGLSNIISQTSKNSELNSSKEIFSDYDFQRVNKGSYWGFRNIKTGKLICKTVYKSVAPFSEGMAAVKSNDKWGYINTKGEEVVHTFYDEADPFSEGFAAIKLNGKWGFINKVGSIIIPIVYDLTHAFSEGLALVEKNTVLSFINKNGNEVFKIIYDAALPFKEGMCQVRLKDKYGFIDKNGKEIIPLIYDYTYDFHGGICVVKLNDKYGVIDINGQIKIAIDREKSSLFYLTMDI